MSTIKSLIGLETTKKCKDCEHSPDYHTQYGCRMFGCLCGF